MTPAELTAVAALGAAALTALASLGVMWLREYLRGKRADRDALIAAVTEMLSRSMAVSFRAQTMGEAMKIRSGLGEGYDVTTRVRKPFDPLEMHDWMAQDAVPLSAAWSVVWQRGDQELIRRANRLLASCGDLIGVSTARMPAETTQARLRRLVAGDRWTPEMQADLEEARSDMANAREQLAQYARGMLGISQAQLFGHEEPEAVSQAGQADSTPPIARTTTRELPES